MHDTIKILKATDSDVADIYPLIAELAEYERAGHELILTSADLLQHFKSGYFKAWVARYENQTVGMALCYDRYSTWKGRCLYLEDIIVQEKYRRIGAGSALMHTLISYARREGYFSINWQVITWNEPALNFYKKWNAEIDRQWWNGRIIINNSDKNENI